MRIRTPEISWFARRAILALDFQPKLDTCPIGNGFRFGTAGFPDDDKYVRLWKIDFENNDPASTIKIDYLCSLGYHETPVNCVKFSPCDPYLATGDSDGLVVVWKFQELLAPSDKDDDDDKPLEKWVCWKKLRDHLPRKDILDVCWSPDGTKLLSCSMDHSLLVWDIEKGSKLALIKEHETRYSMGVAWDPQSKVFVSLSNARAMNIYDAGGLMRLGTVAKIAVPSLADPDKQISSTAFHDDTLFSFARRLCFSPCGELLFAPAGVIQDADKVVNATYIFTRLDFAKPAIILQSRKEIPFAVRCCPLVFELRSGGSSVFDLPYRIIFAVLTKASVVFYDTQFCKPIAYVSNMQFGRTLDLAWSGDGKCLVVSAQEGYCTFIRFGENELGVPMKEIPRPAPTPEPPLPAPVLESPIRNSLAPWVVLSK